MKDQRDTGPDRAAAKTPATCAARNTGQTLGNPFVAPKAQQEPSARSGKRMPG
jgi:hypothetical protein